MNHSDLSPAVEIERERLESVLALVYEDRHYDKDCGCDSCLEIRRRLSADDLHFVDQVGFLVRSSPRESAFLPSDDWTEPS